MTEPGRAQLVRLLHEASQEARARLADARTPPETREAWLRVLRHAKGLLASVGTLRAA